MTHATQWIIDPVWLDNHNSQGLGARNQEQMIFPPVQVPRSTNHSWEFKQTFQSPELSRYPPPVRSAVQPLPAMQTLPATYNNTSFPQPINTGASASNTQFRSLGLPEPRFQSSGTLPPFVLPSLSTPNTTPQARPQPRQIMGYPGHNQDHRSPPRPPVFSSQREFTQYFVLCPEDKDRMLGLEHADDILQAQGRIPFLGWRDGTGYGLEKDYSEILDWVENVGQ